MVIFNEDHILTDNGRNKFGFPLLVESFHNLSNAHFIQLTTQKKPAPIWLAGDFVFMTVGTTPAESRVLKLRFLLAVMGVTLNFQLTIGMLVSNFGKKYERIFPVFSKRAIRYPSHNFLDHCAGFYVCS